MTKIFCFLFSLVFSNVLMAWGLEKEAVRIGDETFELEIAKTEAERAKGLMYRSALKEHEGMRFDFQELRRQAFWMKNCEIPLDMIFIRQGTIVTLHPSVPPCKQEPCPIYPSTEPVDTVIELPAGTIKRLGLKAGSLLN